MITEFEKECIELVKQTYPADEKLEFKKVIYADEAMTVMLFSLDGNEKGFKVVHSDEQLKVSMLATGEIAAFTEGANEK